MVIEVPWFWTQVRLMAVCEPRTGITNATLPPVDYRQANDPNIPSPMLLFYPDEI
jgi:hypothetical protein